MPIMLCSADGEIRKRWQDLLTDKNVVHASTITEIEKKYSGSEISLILLHRPMVSANIMAEIHQAVPGCKIFLLSNRPDEEEGFSFLKQGIVGYANTYISPTRLNEAVRVVLSGSVWLGQAVMQRLIRETLAAVEKKSPAKIDDQILETLTPREREIAELVSKGQSNLEVAFELNISERTVKAHLSSTYAKTGTGSRLNLALLFNRRNAG